MSFERPWLLLALLALPLLAWLYLLAQRRRTRYPVRFTNLAVLAEVAGGRNWRRYVPPLLVLLALAALGVGIARPQVRTLVPRDRATVVLVIDVSGSMEARDAKPTRLAAAREAARLFLDRAPRKLRVGMVVFAGVPQVAAPATTDHELVRQSLDRLGEGSQFGGTAIGDAIAAAVDLGRATLRRDAVAEDPPGAAGADERRLVSILFLSDGAQRRGILSPLDGAQRARRAGMPVYTVALGTPNGTLTRRSWDGILRTIPVPPDPQTLAAIAETTGGEFFSATTAESLRVAYTELGESLGRRPADREVTFAFLAASAVLLVGAGLLSALWSPRLP